MTDGNDADVTRLLRDLTRELQRLQREVEPDRRRAFPTPRELSRVTSEVAIPAVILLLETQIRTLQLLRRLLRMAEGREPRNVAGGGSGAEVRHRAERLGTTALSRLDSALSEVQAQVEKTDSQGEAEHLIEEARDLQTRIREELAAQEAADSRTADIESPPREPIGIDVEAELQSLKETVDDGGEGDAGDTTSDDPGASDAGDDAGADDANDGTGSAGEGE